jgi:hypothetical protein
MGATARLADDTWEAPVDAQMAAIQLDDATIAAVVAALGSSQRPLHLDRVRIERKKRDLALEHASEALTDEAYLERLARLRAAAAALEDHPRTSVPADRAVEWLRAIGATWGKADVRKDKAELLHAVYEQILVAGPRIVSVRLTPAAYGHGLAVALPEVVRARPTGVERALATFAIPIEGWEEWLAAARLRSA